MKILGISGSPRIGGNTDVLLDEALKGARAEGSGIEKIVLNNLKFSPCQECENAKNDGTCIIDDDLQPVYQKIDETDVIILASPIFFGSLSAQMKMMIDRFQCLWRAKYVIKKGMGEKKKKGGFISVEASTRKDFFDNAKSIIKNFFAVIDVDYKEELFYSGIAEKGSILNYPDFLREAFELGKNLII